jgi:hypothetical protein
MFRSLMLRCTSSFQGHTPVRISCRRMPARQMSAVSPLQLLCLLQAGSKSRRDAGGQLCMPKKSHAVHARLLQQ